MRKLGVNLVLLALSLGYVIILLWLVLDEAHCKQFSLCNAVASVAFRQDTTGFLISLAIAVICFGVAIKLLLYAHSSEKSDDKEASTEGKKVNFKLISGIVAFVGVCVEVLFIWHIAAEANCKNNGLCRNFSDSLNVVSTDGQLAIAGTILFIIVLCLFVFVKHGRKDSEK